MKPPLIEYGLFLEEPDDIDCNIGRYPHDQYPEEVIGQHGHDDGKENDRQEDRNKSVSVEDFDDAGYQGGACDSGKGFRMLLEGINEPMAQPIRNRCING